MALRILLAKMCIRDSPRAVDTAVRRLRKKIGEEAIKTRVGLGYVMEEWL